MPKAVRPEIWKMQILGNMELVEVRRSDRKTLSVEVTRKGEVLIRCPKRMSERVIRDFLMRRGPWIDAHVQKVRSALGSNEQTMSPGEVFSEEEMKQLKKAAANDLKERTARWAQKMGVTYTGVSIRFQKTRWGSCSSKGAISLNALLMCLSEEVRDYTVVHELSHRRHMDHSAAFWREVAAYLPDYKERRKELKDQGAALIARLP